ncbi:hypothetical protein Leryth_019624 [Lithospermum erythrorhizon]|nr:hypothetical protein Leryth_019624 [Lithospermum erythrorhizon]
MKLMINYTVELKKGAWSPEEDQKLIAYINKHGAKNWCQMPKAADLKRGRLTADEIETIVDKIAFVNFPEELIMKSRISGISI